MPSYVEPVLSSGLSVLLKDKTQVSLELATL